MQEHYHFTNEQMQKLEKHGVGIPELYKHLSLFSPYNSEVEPTGAISLLFYADAKGDFTQPPHLPHKRIARELFANLETPDQMCVAEYIEALDEGEF